MTSFMEFMLREKMITWRSKVEKVVKRAPLSPTGTSSIKETLSSQNYQLHATFAQV